MPNFAITIERRVSRVVELSQDRLVVIEAQDEDQARAAIQSLIDDEVVDVVGDGWDEVDGSRIASNDTIERESRIAEIVTTTLISRCPDALTILNSRGA